MILFPPFQIDCYDFCFTSESRTKVNLQGSVCSSAVCRCWDFFPLLSFFLSFKFLEMISPAECNLEDRSRLLRSARHCVCVCAILNNVNSWVVAVCSFPLLPYPKQPIQYNAGCCLFLYLLRFSFSNTNKRTAERNKTIV